MSNQRDKKPVKKPTVKNKQNAVKVGPTAGTAEGDRETVDASIRGHENRGDI